MAMRVNGVDEARLHYDGDSVAASDSRSSSRGRIFSNKARKLNLSSLAPITYYCMSCALVFSPGSGTGGIYLNQNPRRRQL